MGNPILFQCFTDKISILTGESALQSAFFYAVGWFLLKFFKKVSFPHC